jgi:hypothetical protein
MCQSAPVAPSAQSIAASQTASNVDTAKATAELNAVSTVGPNGNVTYTQNDPDHNGIPNYTQTTTLSPAGQALLASTNATKQNLANVATDASGRLGGLISAPIDFSAQKDFLTGLTSGALDKTWSQDEATLASTLANKGIAEGSDAYTRAFSDFRNDKSAAYNSANASNFTTALQDQLALRQAPINEILALAGQGGVQGPTVNAPAQTGVAGTDVAGITQAGYQNQVNQYNQQQSNLGGLFGTIGNVAAAAAPFVLSDERIKKDITDEGETEDGVPLHTFHYDWEDSDTEPHFGVLAQEVAKARPGSVGRIGGLLAVNTDVVPEARA